MAVCVVQVLSLQIYSRVSISTTAATSTEYTNMCFSIPQLSVPCFWDYTTMLCHHHRLFGIKNKWQDEYEIRGMRKLWLVAGTNPEFTWTDYIKPVTDQYYCKCTYFLHTSIRSDSVLNIRSLSHCHQSFVISTE